VNTAAKKTCKVHLYHFIKQIIVCHYLFRELIFPALILISQLEKLLDNFINKCFFLTLKDLLTVCHQLLSEGHKTFVITTGSGVPLKQIGAILPQTGFSLSDLCCQFADD